MSGRIEMESTVQSEAHSLHLDRLPGALSGLLQPGIHNQKYSSPPPSKKIQKKRQRKRMKKKKVSLPPVSLTVKKDSQEMCILIVVGQSVFI